jgi:hypothetical protein
MRVIVFLFAALLVGFGFISVAQAESGCGHVYAGRWSCNQAEICVSWSAVVQTPCHPTFTIERRCGLSGNYVTLETDWDGLEYCQIPVMSCLQGFYYKITIHCDDCPGGDSIVIGPVNCP